MLKIRHLSRLILVALLANFSAYGAPVLEGRLPDGVPSETCTASGPTKCAAFYYRSLDITILNERVSGFWSSSPLDGSAQFYAETIGFAATGLAGWLLPTLEQYGSLFYALGPADWQYHFSSYVPYWTSEVFLPSKGYAWTFDLTTGTIFYKALYTTLNFSAIAIRAGGMPTTIPEPMTVALAGTALLGIALTPRRKNSSVNKERLNRRTRHLETADVSRCGLPFAQPDTLWPAAI